MADPALANTMDPASQPNPQPPAPGTPEHQSLFNGWLDYLSHPVVQTALLQFGASMLQPAGWGQSPIGQVGQAAGEAGAAVGRYSAKEAAAQQQAADIEAKKATTLNEAQRTKIAQQEATQTGTYQQGTLALTKEQQAEQARHDVSQEGLSRLQIGSTAANEASMRALQQAQLDFSKQQELNRQAEAASTLGLKTKEVQSQADLQAAQAGYYKSRGAAAGAVGGTKMNTKQQVLISQMKSALGTEDDYLLNHPGSTPDDYARAQDDWYQRIEAAGGGGGTTAPIGDTTAVPPPPATTAPIATPTAAPATPTTPLAPTGPMGMPMPTGATPVPGPAQPAAPTRTPRVFAPDQVQKQKDGSLTLPGGAGTFPPFSKLSPELYVKSIHQLSPEELDNFWQIYETTGGVTPEQKRVFLNKVGKLMGAPDTGTPLE